MADIKNKNNDSDQMYVKVTLKNDKDKDINLMPKTLISQVWRAKESGGSEPSEDEKDNLEYILAHMTGGGMILTDEAGNKYQLSMRLRASDGKCELVAEQI